MLTLFADASFSLNPRKAGYGAWAIHDSWERGYSFGGKLPLSLTNSTMAEVLAIAGAIEHLRRVQKWPKDTVMIQSDSHHALSALKGNLPNARVNNHKRHSVDFSLRSPCLSPLEREAVEYVAHATFGVQVYLRHIKGHTQGEGRNWVNALCDRLARKYANA